MSVQINLHGNWYLTSDPLQWIIYEEVNYIDKEGEPQVRKDNKTYFVTLDAALTSFLKKVSRGSEARDLTTLLGDIEKWRKTLSSAFKMAYECEERMKVTKEGL